MTNNSLDDFLKYTLSQKEVALVIAKDEEELRKFRETLHDHGCKQVAVGTELIDYVTSSNKVFYQIDGVLPKPVYDFVIQYPTGQVEQYNRDTKKSEVVTPIYRDSAFILLTTQETLSKVEQNGFQILANAGMAYKV